MRGVIVGTAGHVDHGKTTLVRALTGVDTDRWAEEKERGLTIDIGFAPLDADPELETGLVDVPGHEAFVKNMLAGSTGVDVLLLVVAADEGPMPQTREHLTIARLLGVEHGVVALSKVDRVDAEWLELVRETMREELSRSLGHARWPIIDVSAPEGIGLDDVRRAITRSARLVSGRDPGDLFRMPVDRSFSVRGAGTVATGTTWSGRVRVGDLVRVLPGDGATRVRAAQVHGAEREEVGPGRRCALALVGLDVSDLSRGSVVVRGDAWKTVRRIGARVEVSSTSEREIDHGQRVRLFLGTAEVMARVRTEDRRPARAGQRTWVVLDCEQPIVARARDRFVLRFYSPVTTIGGGIVSSLTPPRSWRALCAEWGRVLDGPAEAAVEAAVRIAGGKGLADDEVPMVTGLPPSALDGDTYDDAGAERLGNAWYHRDAIEGARSATRAYLREAHRARPRSASEPLESLRAELARRFSVSLVDRVVEDLAVAGEAIVSGPGIRLAGHEVVLTEGESEALADLLHALEESELAPPPPADLARRLGVGREVLNDLLRILLDRGAIVRITPEIFVHREAEKRAKQAVLRVAAGREATPGEFREALGLTRKFLIPLLEHMDRTGVTRRTPAGRTAVAGRDDGRSGPGAQST